MLEKALKIYHGYDFSVMHELWLGASEKVNSMLKIIFNTTVTTNIVKHFTIPKLILKQ